VAGTRDRPAGTSLRTMAAQQALRSVMAGAVAITITLIGAGAALARSPSPAGAAGGDPRSSGEGPGLVGDPMVAIALVAAIALASLVLTLVYIRMTGGAGRSDTGR
jgi:hypothetical protein